MPHAVASNGIKIIIFDIDLIILHRGIAAPGAEVDVVAIAGDRGIDLPLTELTTEVSVTPLASVLSMPETLVTAPLLANMLTDSIVPVPFSVTLMERVASVRLEAVTL